MEINEYLIKLIQTIKDMESLELFTSESQLSKTEFRLLREVVMENEGGKGIISSELAKRLGITRSAVSQLVTKLEARGIVKRVDSPYDRKIAYIQLTEKTYAIFEEQCAQANEFISTVVREYGEGRLKALMFEYDKLAAIFKRVRKETEAKINKRKEIIF